MIRFRRRYPSVRPAQALTCDGPRFGGIELVLLVVSEKEPFEHHGRTRFRIKVEPLKYVGL